MSYQIRNGGAVTKVTTFARALIEKSDKISFNLEGGRLILRSDGTWDYWHSDFVITNGNQMSWLAFAKKSGI